MGLALTWWATAANLKEARSEVAELRDEVTRLEVQASSAVDGKSQLEGQLAQLRTDLETAVTEGDGKERRLENREQALDAREKKLHDRGQELDARQNALPPTSSSEADTDTGVDLSDSPGRDDFDRAWLLAKASDAREDIANVDAYLQDGIGVSTALFMLSDSFGRMREAGVPPGVDAPTYLARLQTLQSFASDAADLYDVNAQEATAKYAVIRKETGILFGQINTALGTNLTLP